MGYSFSWEDNGVYWKYDGVIKTNDLIHANSEIFGNHKLESIRYIIWDANEVDASALDDIAVDVSVTFSAAVDAVNSKIKVAFIAVDKQLMALIEKYIEINRSKIPHAQQKLFGNISDARNWITSLQNEGTL